MAEGGGELQTSQQALSPGQALPALLPPERCAVASGI